MKNNSGKIIILFVIVFCISVLNSQDTSIIKYLPLQVGNTWIYNWTTVVPPTTGKVKIKITGTLFSNGHNYYEFQQIGSTCWCGVTSYSPFLFTIIPMRVDSNSGNIVLNGSSCPWLNNESLIDSLYKKIGDPANSPCNYTICYDTISMNIFGVLRKTKSFTDNIPTYFSSRKYAKYLGLYSSMKGCQFGYTCTYILQGCVVNGVVHGDTSFPVGITQISSTIPEDFSLSQNFPNPFNPVTNIRFSIPPIVLAQYIEPVQLVIYDILGREIKILVNEQLQPGTYEVEFDGKNYPSGVYYYVLSSGDLRITKKMVLIK